MCNLKIQNPWTLKYFCNDLTIRSDLHFNLNDNKTWHEWMWHYLLSLLISLKKNIHTLYLFKKYCLLKVLPLATQKVLYSTRYMHCIIFVITDKTKKHLVSRSLRLGLWLYLNTMQEPNGALDSLVMGTTRQYLLNNHCPQGKKKKSEESSFPCPLQFPLFHPVFIYCAAFITWTVSTGYTQFWSQHGETVLTSISQLGIPGSEEIPETYTQQWASTYQGHLMVWAQGCQWEHENPEMRKLLPIFLAFHGLPDSWDLFEKKKRGQQWMEFLLLWQIGNLDVRNKNVYSLAHWSWLTEICVIRWESFILQTNFLHLPFSAPTVNSKERILSRSPQPGSWFDPCKCPQMNFFKVPTEHKTCKYNITCECEVEFTLKQCIFMMFLSFLHWGTGSLLYT